VVATGNAHKVTEIAAILGTSGLPYRFVPVTELVDDYVFPEETGTTFAENALIKARAALAATGLPALADDSGLVVDALDGRPGVYSSRFAGPAEDDAANNAKLLRELDDVVARHAPERPHPAQAPADAPGAYIPPVDTRVSRSARFVCTLVLAEPDGSTLTTSGTVQGTIAYSPRGNAGFGYDPLFLPDDTPGKTMAQLSAAEKNAISHRSRALASLARVMC
jgi:XTP/dITP diphosphohydrolase